MRKIIMGAGGRDFHNFNVVFRHDPETQVVAFTATQIPGIDDRVYRPSLAGPVYPEGIPIRPEEELTALVRAEGADEVILAYSDLKHETVMHRASLVLACRHGHPDRPPPIHSRHPIRHVRYELVEVGHPTIEGRAAAGAGGSGLAECRDVAPEDCGEVLTTRRGSPGFQWPRRGRSSAQCHRLPKEQP